MIINLQDTDMKYINLDRHKEKRLSMEDLAKDFGFKKYSRVEGTDIPQDPISGCASSHYKILSNIIKPTIILEDDCVLKNKTLSIEVPDNADAVYLGLSEWGYRKDSSRPSNFTFTKHKAINNIYKIDSMLATHAILYISKEYINACTRVAKYSADNGVHIDQGFARIQRYYNVYALGTPIFYQDSNKSSTNISLIKNRLVHNRG